MNNSIFQSPEWEKFKLETGYQKSHHVDGILILQRNLALGRTMLYAPMVNSHQSSVISRKFIEEIKKIANDNNSIFIRLELDISKNENWNPASSAGGPKSGNWTKSFEEMQPENNWIIDLTKNEDEILAGMKQKGRYNIKIAQKSNLNFEFLDKDQLDIFYDQYTNTGDRHKVTYRSKAYFQKLLEILSEKGYSQMCAVYAQIDKKKVPLATAILIHDGKELLYLYGGSSNEHKNLMAPYLLHWEIARYAKENGYTGYNLLGIAPDEDPNHSWAGITRFKKQFGGFQKDIAGCYDMIIKPFEYKLFKIAEKIRRK